MDIDRDTAPESAPTALPPVETQGSVDRTPSRRKLFKLAATAAPVIVAMSNRPAWAKNCVVPSAWCSTQVASEKGIHISQDATKKGSCGSGCSPSYWQQYYKNQSSWNQCQNKYCNLPSDTVKWRSCVGGNSQAPNVIFGSLLHTYTSADDWHFCAAYLSALNNNAGGYCNISKYPLSTGDVNKMYNGKYVTNGHTWTRAECLAYIQTLYDDSSALKPYNLYF